MVSLCILDNYLSIILVISLNAILTASIQPELKLINVVLRHGDRTPSNDRDESFPTDPYVNDSFYPTGVGQLTNNGKKREYELGRALRSRYKDFLGDLYLPKLVVSHSSDFDRTKMSLQLVLAALFPPTDHRQRWNTDLNWQPIPVTYISRIDDNFYWGYDCPEYLEEYVRILNLPEIKKEMFRFKDIMSKLTELTGKNIEKPKDLYFLYHTFIAQSTMNLTLSEWTQDYFLDGPLFDTIVFAYNINGFTPLIRKLLAGPMIRTIFNNMITEKNPIPSHTKLYLYSGHDVNIATMLQAFKLYKPHVPEYSSAVILELLEQNKQYYVKFLYYRGIPPIFDELQIPGCEMLCPFDKFSYLIHDLIPSDEDIVCDKRQTPKYANTEYPITLESKIYNLIKKNINLKKNEMAITHSAN
ncbi:Prostatic acid phosphatase [Camponotus japonicus]